MAAVSPDKPMHLRKLMGDTHHNLPGLSLKFEPSDMKLIGTKHIEKDREYASGNDKNLPRAESTRQSMKRQRDHTGIRRANWRKPEGGKERTRKQVSRVRKILFASRESYSMFKSVLESGKPRDAGFCRS